MGKQYEEHSICFIIIWFIDIGVEANHIRLLWYGKAKRHGQARKSKKCPLF